MTELKTLKDFVEPMICGGDADDVCELVWRRAMSGELKQEAVKIFRNLQCPYTIYPQILENLPEGVKGEIAKDKWNTTDFRYGAEYGMLAMLYWFMDLKEEELN